jgi:dTDP-4-amino-4,6-dideoxygalactose transaminase
LRAWLTDRFIDTATSGLLCASREEAFSDLAEDTPQAFQFIDEMLLLPIHPSMTEDDMCDIAEAVGAFFDSRR